MSLTCCRRSHHTLATFTPAHTPCFFSIDMYTVRQHLVIARFLLLLLLSGTLLQMTSGVPHHCHYLSIVWRHTRFVQYTNTGLCTLINVHMCMLLIFLKSQKILQCVLKKLYLIPCFHCLLILMPLRVNFDCSVLQSCLVFLNSAFCFHDVFCLTHFLLQSLFLHPLNQLVSLILCSDFFCLW